MVPRLGRTPAAALVEEDDPGHILEGREAGVQVLVGERGTAMEDEEGRALPDAPPVEPHAREIEEPLVHRLAPTAYRARL
jgi:beta-phosphoglucomutase-like phosphatase (HAD superfamily)